MSKIEIKRSNSKRTKFMTSLLDTSQEEKAVQITDDCESYGVKLFLKVYIFSSSLTPIFQGAVLPVLQFDRKRKSQDYVPPLNIC